MSYYVHIQCAANKLCVFHYAQNTFVCRGMLGIRRNTWLTHCLLLSIYFSHSSSRLFLLRGKGGKISLFHYFNLQNEGKIRCGRRGNEEGGCYKGNIEHSSQVITVLILKEAEDTVVIVIQEQTSHVFVFAEIRKIHMI